MGFIDSLSAEDRVQVKFSDFYALIKNSARSDLLQNAVKCDVPHRYIREMMYGEKEDPAAVIEAADPEDEGC